MRQILSDVVANERLRARLGNELLAGKLSHAYILSGERGFGKHTLALHLAAALVCEHQKDAQNKGQYSFHNRFSLQISKFFVDQIFAVFNLGMRLEGIYIQLFIATGMVVS